MPTRPETRRSTADLARNAVCPHCGEGRLFDGWLKLAPRCRACGLDYSFADAADGPAVFVMMLIGFVVLGLALMVEMRFHPPLWLHFILWLPLATIGAIAALRPIKSFMVVQQYRQRAAEGRRDGDA